MSRYGALHAYLNVVMKSLKYHAKYLLHLTAFQAPLEALPAPRIRHRNTTRRCAACVKANSTVAVDHRRCSVVIPHVRAPVVLFDRIQIAPEHIMTRMRIFVADIETSYASISLEQLFKSYRLEWNQYVFCSMYSFPHHSTLFPPYDRRGKCHHRRNWRPRAIRKQWPKGKRIIVTFLRSNLTKFERVFVCYV